MSEALQLLELDDAAFMFAAPPNPTSGVPGCAPLLAWQVGHFAVARSPEGLWGKHPDGNVVQARRWIVVHVASSVMVLDFVTREAAWRMADEISVACGARLDHRPDTLERLCEAVPDVSGWVGTLGKLRPDPCTGERPFMRHARWLEAMRVGVPFLVVDDRQGLATW